MNFNVMQCQYWKMELDIAYQYWGIDLNIVQCQYWKMEECSVNFKKWISIYYNTKYKNRETT